MACYSNKTKAYSAKFVAVVSILITILGIITAALGSIQMGVVQRKNEWANIEALDVSGFGTGVLILGAFCVILGLLGCATFKCKKPFFAIPFIILSMIVGLILLILGVIIMGFAGELVDTVQNKICQVGDNQYQNLANKYNDAIQKYVCSEMCPCPLGEDGANQKLWERYDENTFNEWGRTKKSNNGNSDTQNSYQPLFWEADTNKSYGSWRECYDQVIEPQIQAEGEST